MVAGGMESMTQAPYLLPGARAGYRIGDGNARRLDDVRRAVLRLRPVRHGPRHRALQRRRRRVPRAPGRLQRPLPRAGRRRHQGRQVRRGDRPGRASPSARATRWSSTPTRASGPRPPPSRWASCGRPSTRRAPSPPATPSQISDGGAAVIVMSKAKAEELGVTPLGELVSYGQVAGPDPSLLHQPSHAIQQALGKAGLTRRRRRPLRDQRGLRRRRAGLGRRPRHRRATSST